MPQDTRPQSLDFLKRDPTPVVPEPARGTEADQLPQAVIDRLMRLDGVDGVWIEREPDGHRVVVLHYSRPGPAAHLPSQVLDMPTRVVGHEPIRALKR